MVLVVPFSPPRFEISGGQLRLLKRELANSFCQFIGIALVGDSITWGKTLLDSAETEPRDGTLSDPRNVFASISWANEVSRYLGSTYARDTEPVVSNWPASSQGECIQTYCWNEYLYPGTAPFAYSTSGASLFRSEASTGGAVYTNFQLQLGDGNVAGTSYHQIDMPNFTGDQFTLSFGSITTGNLAYEVFVDGVSIGVFTTAPGGSIVVGGNNQRTHSFNYVRNKTVRIRTTRNGVSVGNLTFRPEAIIIPRRLRLTNQGINGSSARTYKFYNLDGNFGDGIAVSGYDQFIFVQLGANDRLKHPTAAPWTASTFYKYYDELIAHLKTLGNVIAMCSNPTTDNDPAIMSFDMAAVRNVIRQVAYSRSVDMVDNYGAFEGLELSSYLNDGVHPNRLGHILMKKNIIGSLELA